MAGGQVSGRERSIITQGAGEATHSAGKALALVQSSIKQVEPVLTNTAHGIFDKGELNAALGKRSAVGQR